jgi:hypothetical protein
MTKPMNLLVTGEEAGGSLNVLRKEHRSDARP